MAIFSSAGISQAISAIDIMYLYSDGYLSMYLYGDEYLDSHRGRLIGAADARQIGASQVINRSRHASHRPMVNYEVTRAVSTGEGGGAILHSN